MAEVLPLQVLLSVMRARWRAGDVNGAVALAKVTAPYLHGRPKHARLSIPLSEVPDDELDDWDGDDDEDEEGAGREEG